MPVDPGHHRVVARAANRKTWAVVIDVPAKRGALVTETVPRLEGPGDVLAPASGPFGPDSTTPRPESHGDGSKIAAITLFSGAAAGAAVGTVFGARAIALNGSSHDHCVGDLCDATGVATRNDARTSGDIATGAFVAAVVLAVGGGAVLFFGRSAKRHTTASISFAPRSDGASLVAGGRF